MARQEKDAPKFAKAAHMAVKNIVKHGDTDIFPRPFESHAFFDKQDDIVKLICDYHNNFTEYLTTFPPSSVNTLTPVSAYGFRWATQLDPIWNAHFLSCVLAIADKIEGARIPTTENCVFSYRINLDLDTGDLFDRDFSWHTFMSTSLEKSRRYDYVVLCDISEFYPRLGHHRIENALRQIAGDTDYPHKIRTFLSTFSNTRSFGLPIGGPAARMLSELTINQVDRLLLRANIEFTRFADDFHIFATTREEAYRHIIQLSEKLYVNQGLTLQKSKTRIMTSGEFRATSPIEDTHADAATETDKRRANDTDEQSRQLMRFSLHFDPYSPTAAEDYERLKNDILKFDILKLLRQELAKSRVHVALSKKIVHTVRYLDGSTRDDAVLSIVDNIHVLYPILSSVLLMLDHVYEELGDEPRRQIHKHIIHLIRTGSHVFRIDVHLCLALRVLQHSHTEEVHQLLADLYERRQSEIVRRDVILIMAQWGDWYWLSDLRNRYYQLSSAERRAFICASYSLSDEGRHWRQTVKKGLNPFEKFILDWAEGRQQEHKGDFPL